MRIMGLWSPAVRRSHGSSRCTPPSRPTSSSGGRTPALAAHWTEDVEAYVRYDLKPAPDGGFRSRAAEDAVRADGRDLLVSVARIGEALTRLKTPTPILTAPMGMFGEAPGIQPPELVAAWRERAPQLRLSLVPDVNHYTIMFDTRGAETIVAAITGA